MEWSTRWEEVKKTVVRGLDFTKEIVHGRVYEGLYLKNLFRESIAEKSACTSDLTVSITASLMQEISTKLHHNDCLLDKISSRMLVNSRWMSYAALAERHSPPKVRLTVYHSDTPYQPAQA